MTALVPEPVRLSDLDDGGHDDGFSLPQGLPEEVPPGYRPRNSAWPLLMDFGWVLVLVGWFIFKSGPVMIVGGVLAVVALVNWIRQARSDFAQLSD